MITHLTQCEQTICQLQKFVESQYVNANRTFPGRRVAGAAGLLVRGLYGPRRGF